MNKETRTEHNKNVPGALNGAEVSMAQISTRVLRVGPVCFARVSFNLRAAAASD